MRHKKLIMTGLVVLLLIDLGLAYQSYKKSQTPSYEFTKVIKSDIVDIVSANGSVDPSSKIDLQFTSSGKVSAINVKVGDKVNSGKVLLSLDTSDLAFQAQNAQAAVQIAQAKLAQLLSGASAEDIALAQSAVLNAQKSLDDASKSLSDTQTTANNAFINVYQNAANTLDSSLLINQNSLRSNAETLDSSELIGFISVTDTQALADAKNLRVTAESDYQSAILAVTAVKVSSDQTKTDQALTVLEQSLKSASKALGRTYDALVATVISASLTQTELDAFKTTISTSRTNINTALTNVISAEQNIASQKITNQTNLNTAQAKVTSAQNSLDTANNQLALKIAKPRQSDIDLYQAQVRQAQATLGQINNQIAQKSLLAPLDGVITNIVPEIGETAVANQTVVSMESLSDFEIKTDIPETDIAKIKIGNPVVITFDAFGDAEKWEGRVVKINPSQTVSQGVVYYQTTIGFSKSDERIKTGMTANIDIETNRHKNALILPFRAIYDSSGQKIVKILGADGKLQALPVSIGIKDNQGQYEIVSGVSDGEQVVIEKTQ